MVKKCHFAHASSEPVGTIQWKEVPRPCNLLLSQFKEKIGRRRWGLVYLAEWDEFWDVIELFTNNVLEGCLKVKYLKHLMWCFFCWGVCGISDWVRGFLLKGVVHILISEVELRLRRNYSNNILNDEVFRSVGVQVHKFEELVKESSNGQHRRGCVLCSTPLITTSDRTLTGLGALKYRISPRLND